MRGSAQRISWHTGNGCASRGLAGDIHPRAPRPRGALPLVGSPAPERFASDTTDRRVRPFGIRAQGALLPETPASGFRSRHPRAGKGACPALHPPPALKETRGDE